MADQDNIFAPMVNYRCPVCRKCTDCIKSEKKRAISINEAREQAIIENSVEVDTSQRSIVVKLPFITDPVEFLEKKFNAKSNYNQARAIYNQQCKKSSPEKEGIRNAFNSLAESGFIMKLADLPDSVQHSVRDG